MSALVFEFLDGFFESGLQLADLAEEQLRETKQNRRVDAAFAEVVDDLLYIGGEILVFRSADNEIALAVDAEIIGTPILDAVGLDCLFYRLSSIRRTPIRNAHSDPAEKL